MKLNAHFECLRQCVNEALCERLSVLEQSVDDAVHESVAPLDQCQREIQDRVDVAVQALDVGQCVCHLYVHEFIALAFTLRLMLPSQLLLTHS